MRKKTIVLMLLSGLVSIALLAARAVREEQEELSAPISLNDVLLAHNVLREPGVPSIYYAEAQRTISASAAEGSEMPHSFARTVTVARYGTAYRYQRLDPLAQIKQVYAFNGITTFHAMRVKERLVEESSREGDSPPEAVGLEIKTFGLLPILRQLSDPNAQAVYEGPDAQGLDRFDVRMAARHWTVLADSEHLIKRVESGDNAIDYSDYRLVDGIWLPFAQQFYIRGQLYYKLSFNRIDLRPELSSDYFNRESVLR